MGKIAFPGLLRTEDDVVVSRICASNYDKVILSTPHNKRYTLTSMTRGLPRRHLKRQVVGTEIGIKKDLNLPKGMRHWVWMLGRGLLLLGHG